MFSLLQRRSLWGLALGLSLATAGAAFAAGGVTPAPTAPTAPPSGSSDLSGAVKLFGDPTQGSQIFQTSCVKCHGSHGDATGTWTNSTASPTTQNYPGLDDVQNSNGDFALDPAIFDVNPAVFNQNLDAFIQNGSRPSYNNSGASAADQAIPTMSDWGFSQKLTTQQMADVEAYVMSLSQVKWPTLTASVSGGQLTVKGSNFLAGSQVDLSLKGNDLGSATVSGTAYASGGQVPYGTFTSTFPLPSGTTSGSVQAAYSTVNIKGIFPGGDPSNMSDLSPAAEGGSDGLGMDGNAGAKLAVASGDFTAPAPANNPPAPIGPAPATPVAPAPTPVTPAAVTASHLPNTGSNSMWDLGLGLMALAAGSLLLRRETSHT